MTDARYPIGKQRLHGPLTADQRAAAIASIAGLPNALAEAVRGLDAAQLDTSYRPGSWSVRQVVHHLADSHLHGCARCKFALTESTPPVKAYDENAWARFADANGPIGGSLLLVQALHERWAQCLRSLPVAAFARDCVHSEDGRKTVDDLVAGCDWHGRHHVAHITTLRRVRGW